MAVANYQEQHGHYPPARLAGPDGRTLHSWRVLILPYIEQEPLFKRIDLAEPWDGPANRRLRAEMPRLFAFHGDYRPGLVVSNYLAVEGPETVWPGGAKVRPKDVTDGLSCTILLVENAGANVEWMEPRDLAFATMSFRVNDPAGVSSKYLDPAVVMLDGSLHRLTRELRPETLRALLTIRGGEDVRHETDGWVLLPDGRQR